MELRRFHASLNEMFPDTLFTLSCSDTSLLFLDVKLIVKNRGLHTDLFTKETDRNTLLQYVSGESEEHGKVFATQSNDAG